MEALRVKREEDRIKRLEDEEVSLSSNMHRFVIDKPFEETWKDI